MIRSFQELSLPSRVLLVLAFLMTVIVQMLNTYLIVGLGQDANMSPSKASSLIFLAVTAGSLIAVTMSFLVDKSRILPVVKMAVASLCVGLIVLGISVQGGQGAIPWLQGALIFIAYTTVRSSVNVFSSMSRSIQMHVNKDKSATMVMSFVTMSFSIGTIVAPVVGESVFELGGLRLMTVVSLSFAVVAALSVFLLFRGPLAKEISPASHLRPHFHRPEAKAIQISIVASLGYVLHAVVYAVLPLKAAAASGDYASVKIFFTSMALTRLVVPMVISSAAWAKMIKPKPALTIALAGLLSANLLLFEMAPGVAVISLILVGVLFGASEGLLSIFTMATLNRDTVDANNLATHNGLYVFLTSSIGIGLGQVFGAATLTQFSFIESALVAIALGVAGVFLVWLPWHKVQRTT